MRRKLTIFMPLGLAFPLALGATLLATPAQAKVSWSKTTKVANGVTVRQGRTADGKKRVHAATITLCTAGVSVVATKPPRYRATASSWGRSVGAKVAVNGDFFTYTTPPKVYGDAVGGGVRWPTSQSGRGCSGSWYCGDYGWIAVGRAGSILATADW